MKSTLNNSKAMHSWIMKMKSAYIFKERLNICLIGKRNQYDKKAKEKSDQNYYFVSTDDYTNVHSR